MLVEDGEEEHQLRDNQSLEEMAADVDQLMNKAKKKKQSPKEAPSKASQNAFISQGEEYIKSARSFVHHEGEVNAPVSVEWQ